MPASHEVSRRDFLRDTAIGSAGVAVPYLVSARALGKEDKLPASERIQVALIGCGGMGQANLGACAGQADVAVTAVCDVWKTRPSRQPARSKSVPSRITTIGTCWLAATSTR